MIRWQLITKVIHDKFNIDVELTLSTQLRPHDGRYSGLGFVSKELDNQTGKSFYQIMLSSVLKNEEQLLAVIAHELAHIKNIECGKDKLHNLVDSQKKISQTLEKSLGIHNGRVVTALINLNKKYGNWDT